MENYNEIWRQISGFGKYYVSNFGRVKNIETEKILKQSKNEHGYCKVCLPDFDFSMEFGFKRIRTTVSIHRLVAIAFIPNTKNKPCVDHIDRNPGNNNVNNLRWATWSENAANKANRSKTKGVRKVRQNSWEARIRHEGRYIHIGTFNSEEEAIQAYNEKATELCGEFAVLNE